HSFQAGAGKASPADAADATHAAVRLTDRAGHGGSAVRRIVIDNHQLPIAAGKSTPEPLNENWNIGPFIERRHNDAELRSGPKRLGRLRRERKDSRGRGRHRVQPILVRSYAILVPILAGGADENIHSAKNSQGVSACLMQRSNMVWNSDSVH